MQAPLVRAGGVTLLVHAAATSMYTVPPSAAAAGVTLDAGEAAAGAGMLHTSSNAPLAVAALQVCMELELCARACANARVLYTWLHACLNNNKNMAV
eukprot:scaffold45546_cov24-Tisochrysis_lutea.AAC.1